MTYLPNALNQYDTYTYNIRLYMVHPNRMSLLDGAIDERAVLIADNVRQTRYNINNMEQVFTVGHNQVRESFGNKFTLTIQEPNGATLLGSLAGAAKQIGISSHLHAGYIMAIDFHGRMPSGRPKKFDQTFYYATRIRALDFKVDQGGTTYNADMYENSTTGYRYMANVIREQITIVAETVGEFVSAFEEKYNKSIINAWAVNPSAGALWDTYRFEFDQSTEAWRNWRFQVLDDPFTAGGINFVGLPGENPKLQITINNGSNITSIFGQVLQLTSEYKRILAHQQSVGSSFFRHRPQDQTSKTLDAFPTFFKMLSNVEYGKFDVLSGEYQKTITYRLKAYVVTDEILDSVAYSSSITNKGVQNRRVANLISSNFMRKRYDYFYTGKNTEVIDFDLQFDYAYYYLLPYGDGKFGDADGQSPQYLKDEPEVMARLAELTNFRRDVAQASQTLQRVQNNPQASSFEVRNAFISFDLSLSKLQTAVDSNTQFLQEQYELEPSDINYHLRFLTDVVSDQDSATSDNDRQGGNLKFGAVKANLENAADLVKIELHVRGDPYWMGVPNSMVNNQRSIDDLADYESGSQNFFLNVNLPNPDEDGAGRRKPRPDYQISGVYRVINVINKFSNGQFTQYLSATRDLATNTSTAYDALAGDDTVANAVDQALQDQIASDQAQAQEDAYRRASNNAGDI